MKHFLTLFVLIAFPFATLHAQASISYFGFHASSFQSSFAGGGGGAAVLFTPVTLNKNNPVFSMNMQLGGGFYLGGGGQTTLKDVVTGNSQVPIEISFNNTHMSGYGLARFMKAAEGKRRTTYVDFHAGMRSSSSTMVVHTDDHEDCATTSLSNSIGFSGGAGIGMLLNVTSFMSVDFGLQWHGTTSPGKYVDMKSVRNSGDGISYSLNNAQPGMLFIKAGLQIQLNKKGCCGVRNCSIPAHHQNCGAGH